MEKQPDDREVKQKYLREQILEEEWNPEEFSEYLLDRREDGTNIDNWDFDELIAEVENFKKIQNATNKPRRESNLQRVDDLEKIQDNLNTIVHGSKIEDTMDQLREELEKKNEKIVKREIILLKKDPKKSNKYIFKLMPESRQFSRKITDLNWLRSNLMAEFPFYYVS